MRRNIISVMMGLLVALLFSLAGCGGEGDRTVTLSGKTISKIGYDEFQWYGGGPAPTPPTSGWNVVYTIDFQSKSLNIASNNFGGNTEVVPAPATKQLTDTQLSQLRSLLDEPTLVKCTNLDAPNVGFWLPGSIQVYSSPVSTMADYRLLDKGKCGNGASQVEANQYEVQTGLDSIRNYIKSL